MSLFEFGHFSNHLLKCLVNFGLVGELKKQLTVETGLQPDEQRLVFRGKVRGDGEYLDMCGVKNGSKMVLEEDPDSMERKAVEMRRNAKVQAVNGLIDDVATEVDRLEEQVRECSCIVFKCRLVLVLI